MSHESVTKFILSVLNRTQELYMNNSHSIVFDAVEVPINPAAGNYLIQFYVLLSVIWLLCNISIPKVPLQFIKSLSEMLFLNVTVLLLMPVILTFNCTVSLIRYGIRISFKYFYHGEFILMNSSDAFWAIEDKNQSCNFNCVYVLQGVCDVAKIRQKIWAITEKKDYERMRRIVVHKFGFFCWRRVSNMNIRNHVKILENPNKNATTEKQVFAHIQKLDVVFPQNKPPWEALIIPNFMYEDQEEGKRHYALIFRVHHAIMDGISAGQIIRNEIADGSTTLSVNPCDKVRISKLQRFGAYLIFAMTGVRATVKSLLLPERNAFHTGEALKGPKTFGWSKKIDLKALKQVKDKTGTTTTAVLLSALGLGLKNLATSKNYSFPSVIHAGPTVAVLPYPNTKPQNRFILAHLPIEVGSGQRIRVLQNVHKQARNLSTSSELIMNQILLWLVGRWPVFVMQIFMRMLHATVLVSNVPGFKEECYLFGDRLVDAVGWPPLKVSTGIAMCLFSYAGKVRAAIVGDTVSLAEDSDVEKLVQEFEKEIECLAADAGVTTSVF
ncbi:unnamed protein product [Allacma fusca]|uniref:Diacylglycerol O-acyltransferase n=1 Tax=Allacma fusca TaxID=39272 RepID=A0A8J2LKK6_9HEXA|nr:unnamed protein product [Allacma fusca]